jgi:hypothetical protein
MGIGYKTFNVINGGVTVALKLKLTYVLVPTSLTLKRILLGKKLFHLSKLHFFMLFP